MHGFIEVMTEASQGKSLVNVDWIQMVVRKTDCTMIYFAFNVPYAGEQDYIVVAEDYDSVKRKIEYATRRDDGGTECGVIKSEFTQKSQLR